VTPRPSAEHKARRAARAALDKKAVDLTVLDVQGVSTVTDYFLVCSGRSAPHVKTIADAIREELKEDGVRPLHAEGRVGAARLRRRAHARFSGRHARVLRARAAVG
jgi:ribosome silencing factor RsfS/YbeB/iojap